MSEYKNDARPSDAHKPTPKGKKRGKQPEATVANVHIRSLLSASHTDDTEADSNAQAFISFASRVG